MASCAQKILVGVSSSRHAIAVITIRFAGVTLGMDMYPPVVPFMADALGSGAGTIQLTLTAYLVLLGAGQLLGPTVGSAGSLPRLTGWRDCLYCGFIRPHRSFIARTFSELPRSSGLRRFGMSRFHFRDGTRHLFGPRGKQRHLWLARLYACDGSCDRPTARSAGRRVARYGAQSSAC